MAIHPTTRWHDLVNAGVLGFDRAGIAGLIPSEPGAWLMSGETNSEPALESVLSEVAPLAIYELAGRAPTADSSRALEAPCDDDDQICSDAATQHLMEILHGGRKTLLDEWLAAAVAGSWHASPETLPALLQLAAVGLGEGRRDKIMSVAGKRGRWLADFQPQWRQLWAETASPEEWETSSGDDRLTMLRRLRVVDRAAARELVQKTWDSESAAERVRLLEQFSHGLADDDEPWLEERLDDRSKQVRSAAAELLSQLLDSAFAQRMAERALGNIKIVPGGGLIRKKPAKVEVTLPDEADVALKRDGVEPRSQQGLGAKASLVSQIVGLAPLRVWQQSQIDAAGWIAAAFESDWAAALVDGWLAATCRQGNAYWAEALLTQVCLISAKKEDVVDDHWRRQAVAPLMEALTPVVAQEVATRAAGDKHADAVKVTTLLLACDFPWNEPLSVAAIDYLHRETRSINAVYDQLLRQLITDVAPKRLAPAVADRVAEQFGVPLEGWSANFAAAVQELVSTVRFRREMLAALRPLA
jgi:hypothetical protein